MKVNCLYCELYNREKGEVTYKNSRITSHEINGHNVENTRACARAWWKIENGHNNALKSHGYNVEHNFGHGQKHANRIFCPLNLLAFLFQGIQRLSDGGCGKACRSFGRKIDFFRALRYEASRYFHKNRGSLFLAVSGHPPDG
jgi:hypothetical protein